MKLIIDIPNEAYDILTEYQVLPENIDLEYFVIHGIPLEDIKAEPYFWEKCPYYEPDMMFDGKDEYDCGKCKYKDKFVLEDIKAEIEDITTYDGYIEKLGALEIIDKHIKENKQ